MESTLIAASHSSSTTGSTSYCQSYSRCQATGFDGVETLALLLVTLQQARLRCGRVTTAAIRVAQMLFASQAASLSRLRPSCLSLLGT